MSDRNGDSYLSFVRLDRNICTTQKRRVAHGNAIGAASGKVRLASGHSRLHGFVNELRAGKTGTRVQIRVSTVPRQDRVVRSLTSLANKFTLTI